MVCSSIARSQEQSLDLIPGLSQLSGYFWSCTAWRTPACNNFSAGVRGGPGKPILPRMLPTDANCFVELWWLQIPNEKNKLCVCVSPPVPKGSLPSLPSPPFSKAGACDTLLLSHATKLWRRVGRETWPVSCTCDATVDQAVPLSAFCFMVFHATTPKQFSQPLSAAARFTACHRSQGKQPLFKHLQFLGLFAMLFHRHPSHRGN